MSTRRISLLQLLATNLAVQSRSSHQRQIQNQCQPVMQNRGEIVKLLANSQSTIAAYAIL
ncbi:hypothetical protein [Scytonema millei]|uniref:Uncharacterized protein n=1 Tax=Scytonema millei VB511283 TaxID=1245923 RepID=A0A9X5E824_9CYAN|nr:hypothetical protein [Scytonema millei]NHC37031.1 hypothetical protein [Scytonema millei VB511283]